MILIIAEKDDIPSLRLIHLLTKNNIKYYFLCIDEEDPLIHINIETNDIFINDVDYREYKAQFSKPMQKICFLQKVRTNGKSSKITLLNFLCETPRETRWEKY